MNRMAWEVTRLVLASALAAMACSPVMADNEDRTCFSYKAKQKAEDTFAAVMNNRISSKKVECVEVEHGNGDDPDDDLKKPPRDKVVFSCAVNSASPTEKIGAVFTAIGEAFESASKYDPNARAQLLAVTCKRGCVPYSCYGQSGVCWVSGKKCISGCS